MTHATLRYRLTIWLAKRMYRTPWTHKHCSFMWQRLYTLAYRFEWDPPDGEDWV